LFFCLEHTFCKAGILVNNVITVTDSSNWMRFVRAAESFKDQNLILSQQGHSLYFTTTRVIHPRQELQVWYSFPYASKRGLPLLQPDTQPEKRGTVVQFSWHIRSYRYGSICISIKQVWVIKISYRSWFLEHCWKL